MVANHVDIFIIFATSLVLRCGIGSEMSTPNFKTTLHTVFGRCFRNKWACSLAVGLFSHRSLHSCRSKVCNAMASGRNMCHPAPPVCWEKGKVGVFARWKWSMFRSETSWSIWKHTVRQQENRRAWTRSLETWNCSLWELCVKLLAWFR